MSTPSLSGTTRWRLVGGITCGWAITPVLAGLVSFICLFIAQNVFLQTVCL
jgi:inorganic phosphate transporter, PiT family